MPLFRSTLAILFITICWNAALAAEFEITVTGGDSATRNVVVNIPVESDDVDSPFFAISGDGFNVMGQVTEPSVLSAGAKAELQFVLPQLGVNEEVKLYAKSISAGQVVNGFHFDDNAGKFNELSIGDRPVMRYMYEALDTSSPERSGETYKVFHHVYDPDGKRFVTKGPEDCIRTIVVCFSVSIESVTVTEKPTSGTAGMVNTKPKKRCSAKRWDPH